MATTFHIPRQSDRELIAALGRIRDTLKLTLPARVAVTVPRGAQLVLAEDKPEDSPSIQFVVNLGGEVIEHLMLIDGQGRAVLELIRPFQKVSDTVTIPDDWCSRLPQRDQPQCWVQLLASARKELRAVDLEAAFKGTEDSAWNRYRDAQAQVINSLQETCESLLVRVAEGKAKVDEERSARFSKLEQELRNELAQKQSALERELSDRRSKLEDREKAVADREKAFETKESLYVARQKQQEQMAQLGKWIEAWSISKGSVQKRTPVAIAYVIAILLTGILTAYVVYGNYQILTSPDAITKLTWIHWTLISAKTTFPFAAFTTFIVYFIRWSAAWASQHAEEDFRNRARLVDIGRASWLLEVVHDAQAHNKEIPIDLLKELSRNLFVHPQGDERNLYPQAAADVLLQGLSSLRVKTPGGAEVEAKREK